MKTIVRPQARREVLAAQTWHEERAAGLGMEFFRAVVAREPARQRVIQGQFRRVLLRRLPYLLLYRVGDDEIVFVGCFHHRQDPELVRSRSRP